MKIIGIDPSTVNTGIAVMNEKKEITVKLFSYHKKIIPKSFTKKKRKELRIEETKKAVDYMIVSILTVLQEEHPDQIIIEDSFLGKDPWTMKMLSRIQGAVLSYALMNHIPISFKNPNTWRMEIGIPLTNGNNKYKREELKTFAFDFIKQNFLLQNPVTEDEAEAICIAYSGLL